MIVKPPKHTSNALIDTCVKELTIKIKERLVAELEENVDTEFQDK